MRAGEGFDGVQKNLLQFLTWTPSDGDIKQGIAKHLPLFPLMGCNSNAGRLDGGGNEPLVLSEALHLESLYPRR